MHNYAKHNVCYSIIAVVSVWPSVSLVQCISTMICRVQSTLQQLFVLNCVVLETVNVQVFSGHS